MVNNIIKLKYNKNNSFMQNIMELVNLAKKNWETPITIILGINEQRHLNNFINDHKYLMIKPAAEVTKGKKAGDEYIYGLKVIRSKVKSKFEVKAKEKSIIEYVPVQGKGPTVKIKKNK